MKLNRSALVMVAMMAGSLAAIGCKSSAQNAEPEVAAVAAPESPAAEPAKAEAPVAAPVEEKKASNESVTVAAKTMVAVNTQAQPPAPPPERYERPTRQPNRDHVWMKGRWHWSGREYQWVNGHWAPQYAPQAPPPVRYENPGRPPSDRHVWMKGNWKWDGRQYVWINGYWEAKRVNQTYVGAHWEKTNGRWRYVPGRWVRR